MSDLAKALAAFDANDISVRTALIHLVADMPRQKLLDLRMEPTAEHVREARKLVLPLESAIALEAFAARPASKTGDDALALSIRLEALAVCPRWESWLSAWILTGIGQNLVRLGRAGEAETLLARALRFMPGDPRALATLAAAHDATGNHDGAARVRAHLRDANYGETIVAGTPTPLERKAMPIEIALTGLEPLSDEDLARYVVFLRYDNATTDILPQPRRHAATLLRRGDVGGAQVALRRTSGWETTIYDERVWLGLPISPTDWIQNHVLEDLLARSPQGAAALADTRKRGKPSPYDDGMSTREKAIGVLAAAGRAAEIARLLADWTFSVRLAAARALPDHPMVKRMNEIQAGLGSPFDTREATVTGPGGDEYIWAAGSHGHYVQNGKPIEYPKPPYNVAGANTREGDKEFPPVLEVTPSARAICKVCKVKIETGALRLCVPKSSLQPDYNWVHARCGLDKRHRAALATALSRSRRPVPEQAELEAGLAAPPPKRTRKAKAPAEGEPQ
jgi:hypothetical protein